MGMLKMAINSSSSFRNSIRINYQELTSVIKESAKILKKQGKKITREALVEIVMLMIEWNSYEELENSLDEALKQIQKEKEREKPIVKFYQKAESYAKEIEEQKGNVTIESLRDIFLKEYLLQKESGEKQYDLFRVQRDSNLIVMAIEHELGKRGVSLKDIVLSWQSKLTEGYIKELKPTMDTLVQLVRDSEYRGENGEAKWMIDSKYVRVAADCVVNPGINRKWSNDESTLIGDELDHLIK